MLFLEIRTVHRQPIKGQQLPSATTTWTASPLFRELNFLPMKREQKVRAFNSLYVIHSKPSALSGGPDCLSLTPKRSTTTTSTWTASPLFRELNFLPMKRKQKVQAFNSVFVIHSKRSALSGGPDCLLSTPKRPTTAMTTWTASPLFRELNFLPMKRETKSSSFQQPLRSTFQTKCSFRRSRLFVIDP